MNRNRLSGWAGIIVLASAAVATAAPLGTAFTYQGVLHDGNGPVTGAVTMQFRLYDDSALGNLLGEIVFDGALGNPPPVDVDAGLFTVELDFGADLFVGPARWLELVIDGELQIPRQRLTPVPYALALPGLWTQENPTSPNLIAGYSANTVQSGAVGATIGGGGAAGTENRAFDDYCTVTGGIANRAGSDDANPASARYATVVGGHSNTATGFRSVIIGGGFNTTTSGTVIGGSNNNASGAASTILGSTDSTAGGTVSTVIGGQSNTAAGPYSLAAGYRAKANHDGAFVFADHTEADFASTFNNQFLIRAAGGVGIGTTAPNATLEVSGDRLRLVDTSNAHIQVAHSGSNMWTWRADTGGNLDLTVAGYDGSAYGTASTDALTVLSTGDVGIGTASPGAKLHVAGNLRVSGTTPRITTGSAVDRFGIYSNSTSTNSRTWIEMFGEEAGRVGELALAGMYVDLRYGSTDVSTGQTGLRLDSSGRVGIGTTAPGAALHIADGDMRVDHYASSPSLVVRRANGSIGNATAVTTDDVLAQFVGAGHDGTAFFNEGWLEIGASEPWTSTAHGTYMRFLTTTPGGTGTFERMRIGPDGNVGIGTDIPAAKLDVAATGDGAELLRLSTERPWVFRQSGAGGAASLDLHSTVDLKKLFVTGNDDVAIATFSGVNGDHRVGIGTVTPGRKFHVVGDTRVDGIFRMQGASNEQVYLDPSVLGTVFILRDASGLDRVVIQSGNGSIPAPSIALKNDSEVTTINLNGQSGNTRTKTLTITGGSDLSENFDIAGLEGEVLPGMVVCIDLEHPGSLVPSRTAYDRTVAGVISGAGGIQTGMLMGQEGTPANGRSPVALTGRVYVLADAANGPIVPGDLLTTSNTPGHAMKVTDHRLAQGAVLGKAMTPLAEGRGLVLILVSLQ